MRRKKRNLVLGMRENSEMSEGSKSIFVASMLVNVLYYVKKQAGILEDTEIIGLEPEVDAPNEFELT